MIKKEFIDHIAKQHKCTKTEAERTIDMFVSSVIGAMGQGNKISLVGFGSFSINKVAARTGRNPSTGVAIQLEERNQVRFKVGKKLRDAVNPK